MEANDTMLNWPFTKKQGEEKALKAIRQHEDALTRLKRAIESRDEKIGDVIDGIVHEKKKGDA